MTAKHDQRRWGHIRKLQSGRFQASFIGPDFHRYNGPRPFDTKMLAEGWLARERERIMLADSGGAAWISPAQRSAKARVRGETVAGHGQRWITERNIKPSTRLLYAKLFDQHIEPALGQITIAGLSADDVNRWHSRLLPDNPTRRSHANPSAPHSNSRGSHPAKEKRCRATSGRRYAAANRPPLQRCWRGGGAGHHDDPTA